MEIRDYQLERLLPTLIKLGYNQPAKKTSMKTAVGTTVPFYAEIEHEGKAEWKGGSVKLYATDAYPVTGKGEAVLTVWTWAGSTAPNECKRIAEALTRAGIPARATTYNRATVVAFEPGDWMECGGWN